MTKFSIVGEVPKLGEHVQRDHFLSRC